ncbi:MAG: SMC-Scp complex subunit ScpB [Clostridia bacterium]|nr:SMC-Scp complex subunit ScpB [Clostridia bacterium]
MENLTNIIESIIFASGDALQVKYIVEKLHVTLKEVNASISELKEKYGGASGVQLLTFNGKVQFATNPAYKQEISDVLVPVREKEFTKTILECAAIIAYKQPITKPELEEIRQVSCDYAIKLLLDLGMIEAVGRKDAIGKPILYATTDNFLKRFKLNSIDELPDYDELMAQIAELNGRLMSDEEDSNYLYKKDEYNPDDDPDVQPAPAAPAAPKTTSDGYEIPDFLEGEEDIFQIK